MPILELRPLVRAVGPPDRRLLAREGTEPDECEMSVEPSQHKRPAVRTSCAVASLLLEAWNEVEEWPGELTCFTSRR